MSDFDLRFWKIPPTYGRKVDTEILIPWAGLIFTLVIIPLIGAGLALHGLLTRLQ